MGNSKKSGFKSALDYDTRQLNLSLEIIAEQKALLSIVKFTLPVEIAEHVQHCVHSGNRLLLYTGAASWASQIRFFQADILNKLTESGQRNIVSLQVRISSQFEQQTARRAARLPSRENISLIGQPLRAKEREDVLQLALARLALTLERRLKAKS